MDAVLTHLWAVLTHPLHSHVPLGAGFLAHSVVQDEGSFTRMAVGGIAFTLSARRATAFAYTIFCIEAPVEGRESTAGEVIHSWGKGIRAKNKRAPAVIS